MPLGGGLIKTPDQIVFRPLTRFKRGLVKAGFFVKLGRQPSELVGGADFRDLQTDLRDVQTGVDSAREP